MSKKRNNFRVGNIAEDITVGNLVAGAMAETATAAATETCYALSADLLISVSGMTPGDGPLDIGLFHGDYSTAEVAECLDAVTDAFQEGDLVTKEKAKRRVRRIGQLSGGLADEVLNDGKPIRVRIKFAVDAGQDLGFYARNADSAQRTTGAVVHIKGKIYYRRNQ